jgi:putative transposase
MTEILQAMPHCYGRTELCRAFGVSRSGLYDHVLKPQGSRRLHDKALAKRLKPIFRQSRRTYGARRLQRALRRQWVRCGRKRLTGQLELRPVQERRSRPRTTQSLHREPIAPNRLNQLPLPPSAPNQVWSADITYLPSQEDGWLYLAAELDQSAKRSRGARFLLFSIFYPHWRPQ